MPKKGQIYMELKVVSFNVQHFIRYTQQKVDMDFFEEVIKGFDADVIGLNEVYGKGIYGNQVADMARRLNMHCYFAQAIYDDYEGGYGNGILSKYPILSARTVHVTPPDPEKYPDYYERRALLQVHLDVPGGLEVNVIHMGLTPEEHVNAVDTVVEYVSPDRSILMGDFNMTPDNPILIPVFNLLSDTAPLYGEEKLSFPSDAPKMKIDYLLTGKDVKALSADIPALVASDHRPYMAAVKV